MKPIDLFAKIYDLPPAVRNRLLSAGIPRVIPIASGLKISIDDVDDTQASSSMPFTRRAGNHVGSMYLGALLVHAESTMATYVLRRCRPPALRVLVKRSEADFLARATGTVRAVCAPEGDERIAIDRCVALAPGEKGEAWASVTTTSIDDGTVICKIRFLISVKRVA